MEDKVIQYLFLVNKALIDGLKSAVFILEKVDKKKEAFLLCLISIFIIPSYSYSFPEMKAYNLNIGMNYKTVNKICDYKLAEFLCNCEYKMIIENHGESIDFKIFTGVKLDPNFRTFLDIPASLFGGPKDQKIYALTFYKDILIKIVIFFQYNHRELSTSDLQSALISKYGSPSYKRCDAIYKSRNGIVLNKCPDYTVDFWGNCYVNWERSYYSYNVDIYEKLGYYIVTIFYDLPGKDKIKEKELKKKAIRLP